MKNFGKTLLKVFVIALVFGIVAASAFAGMTYFFGDRFGIYPFVQETAGIAPAEEEAVAETQEIAETEAVTEEEKEALAEDRRPAGNGIPESVSDADMVEEVMPSIVSITNISTVEYSTFWGQRGTYQAESAGSGIIISQDADMIYIVTNEHVVADAETLIVQFANGEDAEGAVRGADSTRDLAVVEVAISDIPTEAMAELRVAKIGDSTALRVGEPAIAIGNALGYGQSITKGVISALEREVTVTDSRTGASIMNLCIQTDAAINPGNSGGALLNENGEVVGINEIKYSSTEVEGIGYAIPMATAQPIIEQIIANGSVSEGTAAFLGIEAIEITDEDAEKYNMPRGIYLAQVVEDTAADRAGLQVGDIITAIDDREVTTKEELTQILGMYSAGDTIEITFMRTNQGAYEEYVTEAVLGSRND